MVLSDEMLSSFNTNIWFNILYLNDIFCWKFEINIFMSIVYKFFYAIFSYSLSVYVSHSIFFKQIPCKWGKTGLDNEINDTVSSLPKPQPTQWREHVEWEVSVGVIRHQSETGFSVSTVQCQNVECPHKNMILDEMAVHSWGNPWRIQPDFESGQNILPRQKRNWVVHLHAYHSTISIERTYSYTCM